MLGFIISMIPFTIEYHAAVISMTYLAGTSRKNVQCLLELLFCTSALLKVSAPVKSFTLVLYKFIYSCPMSIHPLHVNKSVFVTVFCWG